MKAISSMSSNRLQDTDLFVVERPRTLDLYSIPASALQTGLSDGDPVHKILVWNGVHWVDGKLDGGIYEGTDIDVIDGGWYEPEIIADGVSYDSGLYDPDVPGTGDDLDGGTYNPYTRITF